MITDDPELSAMDAERNRTVKQVIVVRKDLGMRRGKEIAQGSHASAEWLIDRIQKKVYNGGTLRSEDFTEAEIQWVNGLYRKVVCQVGSEAELWALYHAAQTAGLGPVIIQDQGLTEFGKPTYTAVAIGPDYAEKIDPITANLKLY